MTLRTPTINANTRNLQALVLRASDSRASLEPIPNHVRLAPETFDGPALDLSGMHTYRPHENERPDTAPSEGWMHLQYRDGTEYLIPLADHATLDPGRLIREFLDRYREIGERIGGISDHTCAGDVKWTIYLDGQDPYAATCWSRGGAWTRGKHEPARA
jgi:hypothetical protein